MLVTETEDQNLWCPFSRVVRVERTLDQPTDQLVGGVNRDALGPIDVVPLATTGNAILGIRGSGKTFTATWLAEKMMDAGVPIIAFDAIGVWRCLRTPSPNEDGRGYPVVIVGEGGDFPLDPGNVVAVTTAAMETRASVIFDLYSVHLSKADWRRIVTDAVRTLLYAGKQPPRHIFLEEAAEYCPQRVQPAYGTVYAEIEKLARMGRNVGLGYTLINQRAEEVSKAVLELCDNLFLHRQKGRNSLTALSKWLDIGSVQGSKEIMRSMPTLPRGECWTWFAGSDEPALFKVPMKRSAVPGDATLLEPGTVLVDAVPKMRELLRARVPQPAKVEEMASSQTYPPPQNNDGVAAAYEDGFVEGAQEERVRLLAEFAPVIEGLSELSRHLIGVGRDLTTSVNMVDKLYERLHSLAVPPVSVPGLAPGIGTPSAATEAGSRGFGPDPAGAASETRGGAAPSHHRESARTHHVRTSAGAHPIPRETARAAANGLTRPQVKVLGGLAWWRRMGNQQPTRIQLAAIIGWRPRSSNLADRLSELNKAGLVAYPVTGHVAFTSMGVAIAPPPNIQLTLVDSVREVLTNPQRKIFEVLIRRGHHPIARADIGHAIGWSSTSSNLADRLSELTAIGIIQKAGSGMVCLASWVR